MNDISDDLIGIPSIEKLEIDHPCEHCLRWPECNGIDADECVVDALFKKGE